MPDPPAVEYALSRAPVFVGHRRDISSADTIPLTGVQAEGVRSSGFEYGVVRIQLTAGVPGSVTVTLRPIFFDEESGKYTIDADVPLTSFSSIGTEAPGMFTFLALGRRFIIAATVMAGGPTIDIDVAGFGHWAH